MNEIENTQYHDKAADNFGIDEILSHLDLPEYEYVDARNDDYLSSNHMTYEKGQIMKLRNAKLMDSEN